jgi:hypothetical protein
LFPTSGKTATQTGTMRACKAFHLIVEADAIADYATRLTGK